MLRSQAVEEPCITPEELAAMIDGVLPTEVVDRVLAHVDRCAVCSEVVGELGKLDGSAMGMGRYELGRRLGAGAMGIVYEAWDPQLQRHVALKVVRPERADATARDRMLREARALARVNHPHVVTVYDVTELDHQICVATELVAGETLAAWQHGKPRNEILTAWLQAARGLAAAHAVGVIHRDVKPANVLIDREGRVRVGDFGLACFGAAAPGELAHGSGPPPIVAQTLTATGGIAGTPAYMAPEQRDGEADARSDQYALCLSIVEALTGERAETASAIDGELGRALDRGLRRDPAERFESIDDLVAAIEAAIAPPARRRTKWLLAAAACGALAAGSLGFVLTRSSHGSCAVEALPPDVWPATRRATIVAAAGEPVAAFADRWFAAWSEVAADVCTVNLGELVARRRRACLTDLREQFDAKLAKIAPHAAPFDVIASLEGVQHPTRCTAAMVGSTLEPTFVQAFATRPIYHALVAGTPVDLAIQRAWLADAKRVGFTPITVEVGLSLVQELRRSDRDAAAALTRELSALADASGDDLTRVRIDTQVIADLPQPAGEAEAKRLAETIRARIAKLGGDRELEGDLEYTLGTALARNPQDALAGYHRAGAAYAAAFGRDSLHVAMMEMLTATTYAQVDPESPDLMPAWQRAADVFTHLHIELPPLMVDITAKADPRKQVVQLEHTLDTLRAGNPKSLEVAHAEDGVAAMYRLAGDNPAAIEHYQRSLALYDELGTDSSTASSRATLAGLLVEVGRTRDGLALARRAVTDCEHYGLGSWQATALAVEGRAFLDLGDPASARPVLAKAIELFGSSHSPRRLHARPLFLLARATWPVDRARALELAHASLFEYDSAIATHDPTSPRDRVIDAQVVAQRDDLKRWLATHH